MKDIKLQALNLRVALSLKNELQKLADKEKRSLSNYVTMVLEKHVSDVNSSVKDNK